MDEHSSWQLSEVPHSSCPRPWCIDLHNVRFQFWNSESFYDIIVYGITDARSCSFDSRSIIGFLGALKNNTILLWIVSLLFKWSFCFIQILSLAAKHFLDFLLAVSHHVVSCSGGNFGIHSIGVSIFAAVLKFILTLILF